MSKQLEGDPPLLTVAVERGGVLIDAHDQAGAVPQVFVDERHPVADAEVGTIGDLWWRTWPGEFGVYRRRSARTRASVISVRIAA